MPKAVKDHRAKKNPQAHEVNLRRRHEQHVADDKHQWFQNDWRRVALETRAAAGKLTDKNRKEIAALGLRITE